MFYFKKRKKPLQLKSQTFSLIFFLFKNGKVSEESAIFLTSFFMTNSAQIWKTLAQAPFWRQCCRSKAHRLHHNFLELPFMLVSKDGLWSLYYSPLSVHVLVIRVQYLNLSNKCKLVLTYIDVSILCACNDTKFKL